MILLIWFSSKVRKCLRSTASPLCKKYRNNQKVSIFDFGEHCVVRALGLSGSGIRFKLISIVHIGPHLSKAFILSLSGHDKNDALSGENYKETGTGPNRRHILGSKIAKGLQSVKYSFLQYPNFFKSLTMPKKIERGEGPFGIFQHPFCRKTPKKGWKGDPLVSSGIVCYAGNLFGSVLWANRGNLKFCRTFGWTILVTSGVSKENFNKTRADQYDIFRPNCSSNDIFLRLKSSHYTMKTLRVLMEKGLTVFE